MHHQYQDEHDDDRPVGRILSRRELFAVLGTAGATALMAGGFRAVMADSIYLPVIHNGVTDSSSTATPTAAPTATPSATPIPACVVSPELAEGPYFVDERLNRVDIRTDPSDNTVSSGTQLDLTLSVYSVSDGSCTPLSGAVVDIWHCDATGLYSDIQAEGSLGRKFLRGYQIANAEGSVDFTTIYPGWYPGRAIHIHFKVRAALTANPAYEFASQFFFNEADTDVVHAASPYAAQGRRDRLNSQDGIYRFGNGDQLLLDLTQTANGYASTFDIGITI